MGSYNNIQLRYDLEQLVIETPLIPFQNDLIYKTFAPEVEVTQKTARIPLLKAGTSQGVVNITRNEGGGFKRVYTSISDTSYETDRWGLAFPIDEVTELETRQFMNMQNFGAQVVDFKVELARECDVANAVKDTSNYLPTSVIVNTVPVSDVVNFNLKSRFDLAAKQLFVQLGVNPSMLSVCITEEFARLFVEVNEIKGNAKYVIDVNTAYSTPEKQSALIRDHLGCKEVLIGKAAFNTAGLLDDAEFAHVWDSDFMWVGMLAPKSKQWAPLGFMKSPVDIRVTKDKLWDSYFDEENIEFVIRARGNRGLSIFKKFGAVVTKLLTA